MVVTSSRLHAVRYKQAHRRVHRTSKGYADMQALVAFSGTVDRRRARVHRAEHERLPREPDRRASSTSDDYQVLVVAEKFQTGFDQPLLHTMYVDKVLTGLQRRPDALAAQPHPPREDGHVRPRLPQRRRDIQEGVPALLRRDGRDPDRPEPALRHAPRALSYDVLRDEEVEAGVRRCSSVTETTRARSCTPPRSARRALQGLDEEHRTSSGTRSRGSSDLRLPLPDRLVRRPRARARLPLRPGARSLPARPASGAARPRERGRAHPPPLEQTFEGSVSLEEGEARWSRSSGRGKEHELEPEHLSQIIE